MRNFVLAKIILPAFVFTISTVYPSFSFAQNDANFYFFYGEGCPHCAKVLPYIEQSKEKYNQINFQIYEVYGNRDNLIKLNDFYDRYNVPPEDRGVPVIFAGDNYFIGDTPIIEGLEPAILDYIANKPLSQPEEALVEKTVVENDISATVDIQKTLTLSAIIGAAVVDSINPCAIAVLVILLSALLSSGDKRRAIKAGLAFSVSIYIAYFLFGLGLFSALRISGLAFWFNKIIGAAAVLIGLANIKDSIWYGAGGFVTEIPRRWRPTLKKILHSATTPFGAFLIGFVVALFELPCTGGPYFVILSLLAERATQLQAIPLLLLYNIFFIMPLILITAMIYFGFTSAEKAEQWKERNLKRLHFIAGVIMIVLGLLIIFLL